MDALSNRTVRSYHIREPIGSGSQGVVYKAHQTAIDRDVAIKIILPQYSSRSDFIRRFEVEAQVIARLEHPHIVPLYDYWRDPDGAFLVMRWLPTNLKASIERGAWTLPAAARLLDQIAAALTTAHREGIIHRDLKPTNLLLDEDQNVYLADFGIARDIHARQPADTDELVSSPEYLTPEAIQNRELTPRADLYSLGYVMYEVLTGDKPFPDATTPSDYIQKHLSVPMPMMSIQHSGIPAALDEVLQTATAKDPAQRYATAQRFAAAFRAAIPLGLPRLAPQPLPEPLTERELEVLKLMIDGLENAQIAERLFLTRATVKWYVKQIFGKLDVHSRQQAIDKGEALGLLAQPALYQPLPTAPRAADELSAQRTVLEPENPYKGLRAFRESDALDFFGRAALTEQLLSRLSGHGDSERLLVVVGPSGSGKSSVVRAGLMPALRRGALHGSPHPYVTDLQPGTHPFEELEAALLRVADCAQPDLMEHLREDRRGLVRAAKRILPNDPDTELILVIDQFEELFTLVDDATLRLHFIDNLLSAATDPRGRVRIILTLRADFYDRPLMIPRLAELMRGTTETVIPLNARELEQAITAPAERVGVRLESGLATTIINDVGEQPGALPLLQYAMTELFERREGLVLTLSAYREIGGVTGALARRADELYASLDAEAQRAVEQMMLRLVTLGDGAEDTRRRALLSEILAAGGEERRMEEVIDAFVAYRLLTLDRDPVTRTPTVEIAHEALIREWKTMRLWLDNNREQIRIQRRLAAAAAEWKAGRDTGFLATGARLQQFETLAAETGLSLTSDERAYLGASLAERERSQQLEAERRTHEIQLERRAVRFLRLAVILLSLIVLSTSGLSIFAIDRERQAEDARSKAQRQADVNHSLVLADEALRRYDDGTVDLALALALEAVRIADPPQDAVRALSTVAFGMGTRAMLRDHGSKVTAAAFNSTAQYGLTGGCAAFDGEICTTSELIVWDLVTHTQARLLQGQAGWITSIAASPTAPDEALTASEDGTLFLWNVTTGTIIRRFEGHVARINQVAYSADGQTALSGGDDHAVILWDVATGRIVRRFEGRTNRATTVALSPDGQYVAAGGDTGDSTLQVWDTATGDLVYTLEGPRARILATGFRTNEQGIPVVYAYSFDKFYREWTLAEGTLARTLSAENPSPGMIPLPDGRTALSLEGNVASIVSLSSWARLETETSPSKLTINATAVSRDGRLILLGTDFGEIVLSNLPVSQEVRRFDAPGGLGTVAVTSDGRYLVTGGVSAVAGSASAILWDAHSGEEVRRLEGYEPTAAQIAISPDGRTALVCLDDVFGGTAANHVVLWDLATGDVLHVWDEFAYHARAVAFSPDGRTALVGTLGWGGAWSDAEQGRGELALLDLVAGGEIRRFDNTREVLGVSISPDGLHAVTAGGATGRVTLWDITTGQAIRRLSHLAAAVRFVDSRYFLTDSEGGYIHLIDSETGNIVRTFTGATTSFWSIDLSPDGNYLLAAGEQAQVMLWNYHGGELIRVFHEDTAAGGTWNVAFSPDGQMAYSSQLNEIGDVVQWRVADLSLPDLLSWVHENRYARDFTCEERAQYQIEPPCEDGAAVS